MAVGSYKRADVRCPFYRYDKQTERKITCEGVQNDSTQAQTWKNGKQMDKYLEKYCCGQFEDCAIHRLLMQEKYKDEE